MHYPLNPLMRAGLAACLLLIAACGSSGGSGTPETPTPPDAPAPSGPSDSNGGDFNGDDSDDSDSGGNDSTDYSVPTGPAVTLCGYPEESGVIIDSTIATKLEAENFDGCEGAFSPVADQPEDGYRGLPVDIRDDEGFSNGHVVHHDAERSYFEYSVNVARSGRYNISYYVQPGEAGTGYRLMQGERTLTDMEVIRNASDGTGWRSLNATDVYLTDGPQVLRLEITQGAGAIDYMEFIYTEDLTLDAHTTVQAMGVGINLGNTLDAPAEGEWALPAEKHHLEDFHKAGFLHVRIPVTWGNHMPSSAPYWVRDEGMARTEQIVDWALEQGFYVTLNAHHESWLKGDNYTSANRARFDALWTQIAERFKNKSARLIFEILNEPEKMTAAQVNPLNKRLLNIIRASNPTRLVVISGEDFSGINTLATLEVPDDDYLIGNFHSYDPWEFAGACTRTTWGTQNDKTQLANMYQTASAWSKENGIPVMVNEFGAAKFDYAQPENRCELSSRLEYLHHHVTEAARHGMAATFWDDGGSFSSYDRDKRTWGDEKDVLVAPNPSP